MRAALYTRVSSQEQVQHGVSLAEQKERLEALAKLEGWEIAGIYSDEGYSGGDDNRPQLQNLMLDAKAGRFDIVVVTKLDRFFRNTRQLLNYVYGLESNGVTFVSHTEGIDTSKPGMSKVILSTFGSFAEMERERIGQRISDFRNHLANKGQWSSGRTPFGYRFNKETKELVVDPLEAEAVKFIFKTYTSKRVGIVKTAELANKKELITPRPGRRQHTTWTQSAIRHILTHPAYKGGPNDDWPFKTPSLVTPELWELAQRQLAGNRHFRASENHNPFTGLLRCGLCGHTLRIGYNHNTQPVWECPGRLKRLHLDDSPRCALPRLDAPTVGDGLIARITEIFSNPETLQAYITKTIENLHKEHDILERKLKPIQSNYKQIEGAMQKADTMFELGRLSHDDYRARIAGLRRRLKELEQQTTEADPLLLKQLEDNKKALDWYKSMPNRIKEFIDLAKKVKVKESNIRFGMYLLSDAFNSARVTANKTERGFEGKIEWRAEEGIANYLRRFGLYAYIYPDRVEIKGAIRQSNITAGYSKEVSLPLSITLELSELLPGHKGIRGYGNG